MVVSKTSDHIHIKIKMQNHSQEPPASSKSPNEDLKDIDGLCTFKIKIESQNFKIKIKMLNPIQEPQAPTKAANQALKTWIVLHLQNQDKKPKFGTWMYQRPVTTSKSK